MTWGELKAIMEKAGVEDTDPICFVDLADYPDAELVQVESSEEGVCIIGG
jgi:hypothetical protein